MHAYVGGYTTPDRDGRGDGINVYRVGADGSWTHVQNIGGLENPSLFVANRAMTRLYAVHGGRNLLSAFAIDRASGRLSLLNQIDCLGENPVDAALDADEGHLAVANYGTGAVAVAPLDADGRLLPVSQVFVLQGQPGPDPHHQASSHPHAAVLDPSGRFLVVPDKGFDKTFLFRFDGAGVVPTAQGAIASRAGAAPRHAAFHPTLDVLYVNNELDSTVTAFRWDKAAGAAAELQTTTTIPNGFAGRNTTAEIAASADGRFLYVSNRGEDSIVRFAVDPGDGRLSYRDATPTGGKRPRFFAIAPGGRRLYAANQDSDDIAAFAIDPADGSLRALGIVARPGSPSAIVFVP